MPYFPMLLGNGKDWLLLGYAGTMGACGGHEHWVYGDAVITGWFKADQRVAGSPANLLQSGYFIRHGLHAFGMSSLENQRFDAVTGVLHNHNRHGRIDVAVQSCLTADSVLLHKFELHGDLADCHFQFFIKPPGYWDFPTRVPAPEPTLLNVRPEGRAALRFEVAAAGKTFPGRLGIDHPGARPVICYNRRSGLELSLRACASFTVSIALDDAEGSKPRSRQAWSKGAVGRQWAAAGELWRRRQQVAAISCREAAIGSLYQTSLYQAHAHQHPGGAVLNGAYSIMWGGYTNAFDASYFNLAFLGADQMAAAEKMLGFWQQALPIHLKATADLGLPGVHLPAELTAGGEDLYPLEGPPELRRAALLERKQFMTANLVLNVWQLYRYSGRVEILERHWSLIEEPLRFLLGACVSEFADHAEIIRSSGPNGKERKNGKIQYQRNPLRTLLGTIEAVRAGCQAAAVLKRPCPAAWQRLLPKLERGVQVNCLDGRWHANRSPNSAMTTDPMYTGLFATLAHWPTLKAELAVQRNRDGDINWPAEGYTAIPWMNLSISAAFSRLGKPGAAELFERGRRWVTSLGAFPEAVRPDGAFFKVWYPTVHASYMHALHLLLVRPRPYGLELFGEVPAAWGDLTFSGLRAPPGVLVSGWRRGRVLSYQVENASPTTQTLEVRGPGGRRGERLVLAPGEKSRRLRLAEGSRT